MAKQRLSATVDAQLIETALRAVAAGRAESVSAWVNEAMRRQADHEARLKAADEVWEQWQAEFGPVSDEELERAHQELMARAIKVEPKPKPRHKKKARV
jgi:Arc/MetJ-type ribon-helix-helix transcriptional regulator